MPVNKSGLGIQNLVNSVDTKYPSSQCTSTELIWAITEEGEFSTADCLLALREESCDKKIRDDANDDKLKGLVEDLGEYDLCLILHAKNTGSCLNLQGTTVKSTVLVAMEFCDFFCTLRCYLN